MKSKYKEMNMGILPGDDLADRVMDRARGSKRMNLRPMATAAAVLMLLLVVTPVVADDLISSIMYLVAPELAERYDPVGYADEDNGVRLEVVAATVHGNVAEMVVRVQGDVLKCYGAAPLVKSAEDTHYRLTYDVLRDYEGAEEDIANGIMYLNAIVTYCVQDEDGGSAADILGNDITIQVNKILYRNSENDSDLQYYYCDCSVTFPFIDSEYSAE